MSVGATELVVRRGGTSRPVSSKRDQIGANKSVHEAKRLDAAVAYRLHRTNRLLLTHLARFLETSQHGLTPEKWFVLARIRDDGPLRQVELTDRALEDAPNVSRLVESLVVGGLVERSPDPDDRRSRILQLTASGAALAEELHERSMIERLRVFDGFSEADLAALVGALDRLEANVRPSLMSEAPA